MGAAMPPIRPTGSVSGSGSPARPTLRRAIRRRPLYTPWSDANAFDRGSASGEPPQHAGAGHLAGRAYRVADRVEAAAAALGPGGARAGGRRGRLRTAPAGGR